MALEFVRKFIGPGWQYVAEEEPGGGGAAFNGGTVTDPINIEVEDDAVPALVIAAQLGGADNSKIIRTRFVDGTENTLVAGNGEVSVAPQFGAARAFNVYDANGNECFHIHGDGTIRIAVELPTVDPVVEGQLWNSSGALMISAGP